MYNKIFMIIRTFMAHIGAIGNRGSNHGKKCYLVCMILQFSKKILLKLCGDVISKFGLCPNNTILTFYIWSRTFNRQQFVKAQSERRSISPNIVIVKLRLRGSNMDSWGNMLIFGSDVLQHNRGSTLEQPSTTVGSLDQNHAMNYDTNKLSLENLGQLIDYQQTVFLMFVQGS